MKFGIVGNNDGPLTLLQSLTDSFFTPEFVGLQKKVSRKLEDQYLELIPENLFFYGFEETILLDRIERYNIDLLINCFCNFKFKKLLHQNFAVINIHLSLLPAYRGRHPLHWALINGKKKTGYTIHYMNKDFDGGDILFQQEIFLNSDMSVNELRFEILGLLKDNFRGFLSRYKSGNITQAENDDKLATKAPRRYPSDSELTEWHNSALIYRKIKALRTEDHPAYLYLGQENLKITCLDVRIAGQNTETRYSKPTVIETNNDRFKIACPDGNTLWIIPNRKEEVSDLINKEISR